jgi:hypothetical protein
MNQIHVNALFGRLVKLVGSGNVRPLDMLALPNLLPQVRYIFLHGGIRNITQL